MGPEDESDMTIETDGGTAGAGWDHAHIDAAGFAERYVTGRLSPAETAAFEEHYLDCAECCARVEDAERMQRGMHRLAEEEAVRAPMASMARTTPAVAAVPGLPGMSGAWHPARTPRLALAAAALLALGLLPAAFERQEIGRLRRDLAATERQLDDERRPQANLPVLAIGALRGGGGGGGTAAEGPVRTFTLPRQPGRIALWIEADGDEAPAYRVTLTDAAGRQVLAASPLSPNGLGALLLTLHSSTLTPGDYRLVVEGLPNGGRPVVLLRAPLRFVAAAAADQGGR